MKYSVLNKEYYLLNSDLDKYLKKLDFFLNNMNNMFCLIYLVVDDASLLSCIVNNIKNKSPDLKLFDVSLIQNNLEQFNYLIKNNDLCLFGFDKLDENVKYNFCRGLNIIRDSVFLKYKHKLIFVIKDKDYMYLINNARDLYEYKTITLDFNDLYMCNGISLSNDLQEEQLNKIFKK